MCYETGLSWSLMKSVKRNTDELLEHKQEWYYWPDNFYSENMTIETILDLKISKHNK